MMIHHVFANRSNVGDWLSAKGIQRLLAPLPVKEYLCDEPFVPDTLDKLAKVAPDDFIIIGGGGLFSKYFNPFWSGFADIAHRVPYAIWGVGCCDIKMTDSLPPLELIERIVKYSRLCVVRDKLTRMFLKSCNLPPAVPCPTLNALEGIHTSSNGILHADHFDNIGSANFDIVTATTETYAKINNRIYRRTNNLISAGSQSGFNDVMTRYEKSDLIVSSRLHGCIIGLALGCKVLAISGDRKVESFMTAAGLADWVCDVNEIESLTTLLERLPFQPSAEQYVEQAREQNRLVAKALLRQFAGAGGHSI
jgi:polysaccharide pyruvyl transferase WcaK-like protein